MDKGDQEGAAYSTGLGTIIREWTRIGCVGFGGPPTHISFFRRLCVEQRSWMDESDFEDAIAATNLLPGPASTQLAIFCAWRLRGAAGAVIGGVCFIIPGLLLILLLAFFLMSSHSPVWVLGASAGAGAAVPAVALNASWSLAPASHRRIGVRRSQKVRWVVYAAIGAAATLALGSSLVLVLLACGLAELLIRQKRPRPSSTPAGTALGGLVSHTAVVGTLGAVAWVALKVGALSYGGGFVIVPLMQHDAVNTYHWLSGAQFLDAVALGQITPGPVVQTVAAVGYAAAGFGGGLLAAVVAFTPSFLFVLIGAPRFDQIRKNVDIQAFLTGAGPAVIGAIAGSAISLALAVQHLWQIPILAGSLIWLLTRSRSVVTCLLIAGAIGIIVALAGVTV
ncbi:MAG: chromate efflux transporter [Acidimicrobiaceae bacterium]|nr:chromate efflux transporter [Acidimicrobiaceae bacterium]